MQHGPKKKNWSIHDLRAIRPLTEKQEDMFHSWFCGDNVCAHGSAGTGKAQPLYSKVLTPTGWKFMGDLEVGDYVVTPEGKQSEIKGVFPQGIKDIYTITFSDGSVTECCKEHLWECYMPVNLHRSKAAVKRVVSTSEMIDWLDLRDNSGGRGNISIDLVYPIPYGEKQLPIDPYVLGALIGDGSMITATPRITSADEHIVNRIDGLLLEDYEVSKIASAIYCYSIRQTTNTHRASIPNAYTSTLKSLGMYGKKAHQKFIPDQYKHCSIEQRLELVKGLMDTDGTVGKNRDVSYTTTSKLLASDLQNILWSLGAKCSMKSRYTHYTYKGVKKQGRESFTLHISYREPKELFSLPRKRDRCSDAYDDLQMRRQVKSIEHTSTDEAQCIMIDDSKHLYITDDYIITHNTFLAFYLALSEILEKGEQKQIIVVRSAVAAREIGYLPGTKEEKEAVFEIPYTDICHDLFGRKSTYDDMKEAGKIKFMTTSHIRGLTWDNSIIIVDEIQNMCISEIDTIMTRVGKNTRVILCGDSKFQCDLKKSEQTGIKRLLSILNKMKNFSSIQFNREDIVRSEFVKQWITASEKT